MYSRFKRGLLIPSELPIFLKDTWVRLVTYFFLLVLISMLPFMIAEYPYQGMTSLEYRLIDSGIQTYLSGDYGIVDGKLGIPFELRDKDIYMTAGAYTIAINNTPSAIDNQVARLTFLSEGIRYSALGYEFAYYSYTELGLENYDFNDYSNDNKEKLLITLDAILRQNQFANKFSQTILQLSISAFEVIFIVSLTALFFRKEVPYRYRFKMSLYATTIYVVCALFSILLALEILTIVGLILVMVYNYKALNFVIIKQVKDE